MARFRSRVPARRMVWEASSVFSRTSTAIGEDGEIDLIDNTKLEALTHPTIMRIRGHVRLALGGNLVNNAQTAIEVALGIQLVDVNLITLGNIGQSAQAEDSWLWYAYGIVSTHHKNFVLMNSTGTEVGTVSKYDTDAEGRKFFEIDTKAMRKVPRGKKLVLAYTVGSVIGSPPSNAMRLDGYVRCLLKE